MERPLKDDFRYIRIYFIRRISKFIGYKIFLMDNSVFVVWGVYQLRVKGASIPAEGDILIK